MTTTNEAGENAAAAILERLALGPDATLFLEREDRSVSGAAARRYVALRQAQLAEAGLGPGSTALVSVGRGIVYWLDLLALWSLGAVAAPLEPALSAEDRAHVFALSEPHALLQPETSSEAEARGAVAIPELPEAEWRGWRRPLSVDVRAVRSGDPSTILFTSGSTGRPKGVLLSHRAVAGNARATQAVLGFTPGETLLFPVPFRFVSALSHFMVGALGGARLVATEARLLPRDLKRLMLETGANRFGGSPLQARWIAELAEREALPVRWIMSSGDHLPVEVIRHLWRAVPGIEVVVAYGLTEVGGRVCILRPELLAAHLGVVGAPIEGLAVTVRDEAGAPVPHDTPGEVHVEGELLFDGYIRNPEATARVLDGKGFKTGDLGRLGPEGMLSIEGRSDDVFKSAGHKVSAQPIVEALLATGMFADAAVVARSHTLKGHVPHAFLVPRPGETLEPGRLRQLLRERLPSNHIPEEFHLVEAIPRTGSGKARRGELRRLAEERGF